MCKNDKGGIRKRRSISQRNLSAESGVCYGSIKRFESTGKACLVLLLTVCQMRGDGFCRGTARDMYEVIHETLHGYLEKN